MKSKIKIYSWLNLLPLFLSTFILFVPMMVFLASYNQMPTNPLLLQSGHETRINLPIVISLVILCVSIVVSLFYLIFIQLKQYTSNKIKINDMKLLLIISGVSIATIILFLIAFFVIWQFPINIQINESINISKLNFDRLIAYIATYLIISILSFIVIIILNLKFNSQIESNYSKELNEI